MSPCWSGLVALVVALRLAGVRRRLPWTVVELTADAPEVTPESPQPGERRSSTGRGGVPQRPWTPAPAAVRRAPVGRGRRARRDRRLVEADLPAAVDLLHVAVTAGHSLHTAVAAVGGAGRGPVSAALAEVDRRFRRGSRLVDELDALASRLGPAVRPLSTTLVVAASSGAPLGPALQRLADAERRRLRRRTEERVRRLPVVLLAPLVGLVLPAFVLLTVVPVAITTARTGLLPATGAPASADETFAVDPPPGHDLPPTSIVRRPP